MGNTYLQQEQMKKLISSAIVVAFLLEKLLTVFCTAASFMPSQLFILKHCNDEQKEPLRMDEKLQINSPSKSKSSPLSLPPTILVFICHYGGPICPLMGVHGCPPITTSSWYVALLNLLTFMDAWCLLTSCIQVSEFEP